jgi:hypothetical protein
MMMIRTAHRSLALSLALLLGSPALAQSVATEAVTVTIRPGVTIRYLALVKPSGKPAAAVMLFSGGSGVLRIGADGALGAGRKNFLVRSREQFARHDLYVAVVDVPSNLQGGLNGDMRRSQPYAEDMAQVIGEVRRRAQAPVWLVGTSSGTISAAGVAARLRSQASRSNDNRPNGVVLTSPQTKLVQGLCGRTVFNADLAAINVPVLVASHRDDRCPCSPAAGAGEVIAALTNSPAKEVKIFDGGRRGPPSEPNPCEALTPHGYLDIEETVVRSIADWIKSR